MNHWSLKDLLFLMVALILAGLVMRQVPLAVDEEIEIENRKMKKIRLEMAKEVIEEMERGAREMLDKARREKDGPTKRR